MQTITTKYLPMTSTKPSRYRATTTSGITIVQSVNATDTSCERARDRIVAELVVKLGWNRDHGVILYGGALKPDHDVYVIADPEARLEIRPDGTLVRR